MFFMQWIASKMFKANGANLSWNIVGVSWRSANQPINASCVITKKEEMEHHANEANRKRRDHEKSQANGLETQRKVFHLEHANLKMQQDIQAMSKRIVKEKWVIIM